MHQRRVPGRDARGPLDQLVQGLLANLRAVIGQQGGDRAFVVARGDGVGHPGAQAVAPGDRRQLGGNAGLGDDLQQVGLA